MSRIAATIPVLVALAVCTFGASAAAAGTFTFKASADTYANQAYPSKSYGGAKRVWAQGAKDPFNETFARFTASGITGTVTGATLRFYVTNGTNNGPSVYSVSNSWSETAVAWNLRPATISGPRDDKGALARNQWVVWDVTPWVTANGTYSFALKQGAADATGFMSRETTKSPTLVITTVDPVPPPPPPDPDPVPPPDPDPVPPPPPPTGTEPAPIAGQGYTQRFADEFDAFGGGTWGTGIWYNPGAPANSVFVQSGVLNLVSRRSQGYPDITVSTEGGSNPSTFTHGYFEARMRWTKGDGAWPAFWLLSYRHAVNPSYPNVNSYCSQNGLPTALCYSAELDVFEGQGSEPSVFYGTSHRNSCGCYGVANTQNGNNYHNVGTDLTTSFHTYGMLWTATTISWYLDGVFLASTPVYDSTNQPQFLLLQMWIGGWTRSTTTATPDELKTEVDWLRVWQK